MSGVAFEPCDRCIQFGNDLDNPMKHPPEECPNRRPIAGGEALFIGEANPYGDNSEHALFPYPERSAGGRLCRVVLGLSIDDYLERFDRVNLCRGAWSIREARDAASGLIAAAAKGGKFALLGSKVCRAFDLDFEPYTVAVTPPGVALVILPHPSGLCRLWYRPGAVAEARRVLGSVGVALPAVAP